MQDPNSIIAQAFDGYVTEVADELGLTYQRVGEIIGKDNPYPKLWRILNPLGRLDPERLCFVKADFNARCDRILNGRQTPSTACSVHKEVSEAIQKIIAKAPRHERRKEITEAIAELAKELEKCDSGDE